MDDEPTTHTVTLRLCSLCLTGVGGECHVPTCALFLSSAPDMVLVGHPLVMAIEPPCTAKEPSNG